MWKILVTLVIVIVLSACSQTNESASQDKSDNYSNGTEVAEESGGIDAEVESFKLEEATEQADLIGEVTITEKVEEIKADPIPYTVFKAKVNNSFHGEVINEEITIKQQGDSEWTFNGNELFEEGEKYIFFLKETIASKADYWIIGEGTGMFEILDNEIIVKLNEPIEQLKDVELPNQSKNNGLSVEEKSKGKSGQLLDKKQFIEKIKAKGGGS